MLDAVLRCLPDGELLGIISQSPQADQDTPPLAALIREYSNSPVPQLLVPVTIHSGLHRSARGVRTTAFLRPGDLDAMHLILAATAHPRSEARMAANLDALLTYADQSYEGDDTWLVCTSPGLMHLCGQGHGGTSRPLDLPILPGRTGIH